MTPETSRREIFPAPSSHILQFYDTERFLSDAVSEYVGSGLEAGEPAVIIASWANAALFAEALRRRGHDVAALLNDNQLILVDADDLLTTLMPDGMLNERLFREIVGELLVRSARSETLRPRAYGEMADILWRSGRHEASLRLEELWNELTEFHSFTLLCSQAMSSFHNDTDGLDELRRRHGHVNPAG